MIRDIQYSEFKEEFGEHSVAPYAERWTRKIDMKVILPILSKAGLGNVLEIGTATGLFTQVMRQVVTPGSHVWTMGITREIAKAQGITGSFPNNGLDELVPEARLGEAIQGPGAKFTIIPANSVYFNWASLPSMKFIFIDGGHDYYTVMSDTKNAMKLIDQDGFIVWHDANKVLADVDRVLEELDIEVTRVAGTWVAYYKKA